MMLISFNWPTTCTLHQGKTDASLIPDIPAPEVRITNRRGMGKSLARTTSWAGVTQSRERRASRDSGSSRARKAAKETINVYTNTCKY